MIKIICIKWNGRKQFNDEYVNKLFRGVQRNTSKEFSFMCFSNDATNLDSAIEQKPITNFTGDWFSKISLYNKELYNENDQIFYFDLDTVIIGNIDDILSYEGDFAILQDFYRKKGYGSGFMSWRPHAVHHMYQNYRGQKCRHGDQGWCEVQYPGADLWQNMYPQKVISYKIHVIKDPRLRPEWTNNPGTLETASIVCFHGRPRPHDVVNLFWMKEHWK